ncbi:MAG: YraN family protein [Clostridiales bacterium]|nr:YraN family protein [Clostridiales bacterium]
MGEKTILSSRRAVGSRYEDTAACYLKEKGYEILARNYRNRYGEIDIIAKDETGVLVVVEAKYRSDDEYGDPLCAVDLRKQRRISRTTLWYYMEKKLPEETPCRFDVIAIHRDGRIQHIENAFDFHS